MKQLARTVNKKSQMIINIIDIIFEKHIWWIIFSLVSILLLVIFHEFIVGKVYYLFSDVAMDSLDWGYPLLIHAAKYLRSEGFPLWSFSQGMGQNIMSSSLGDPFLLDRLPCRNDSCCICNNLDGISKNPNHSLHFLSFS